EQPGHVAGEVAHGLQPLRVLGGLAGGRAEGVVPVGGADNGHLGDGEVLVEHVEAGDGARPAGHGHGGGRLVGQLALVAVEQPVQEGDDRAVGRGVVHGAADYEPVGGAHLLREGVNAVVYHAAAEFGTCPAGPAAGDVQADVYE